MPIKLHSIPDYEDRFANPFVAAERGFVDEVIQPRSTRKRVARAFASLRNKKAQNPWKSTTTFRYKMTWMTSDINGEYISGAALAGAL